MAPARILVLALLLSTTAALAGCLGESDPGAQTSSPDGPDPAPEPAELYVVATDHSLGVGTSWNLHPVTFEVETGQSVEVTLKSADGNSFEHTLVIEGYDIHLGPLTEGETETVTFVADQEGTFAYFCDVGNHRELGMEGTLTVGSG